MAREFYFTGKDINRIFLRSRRFYVRVFMSVFGFVCLFYLCKTPLHTATALFKQTAQVGKETELFQTLMQSSQFAFKESGAQPLLESRTLLKQVVESLGLQVEVKESLLTKWSRRAKNRLYAELGISIEDKRLIHFCDSYFMNGESLDFSICFKEEGCFEIVDKHKRQLAKGVVGAPVSIFGGVFTVGSYLGTKGEYHCRIHPWIESIKKIRSHLQIKPSKIDKNILSMSFSSPYASEASSVLNQLMLVYQDYLRDENKEIASLQMCYLQKRQEELIQQYDRSLEDHVAFLGDSLKDTGFMSFKQELDLLERPNEEYVSRLYDVDLHLRRLSMPKEKEKEKSYTAKVEDIIPVSLENVLENKTKERRDLRGKAGGVVAEETYGMTPDTAQGLLVQYEQQLDGLRIVIEQLRHVLGELSAPFFDITSLSELLPDKICQETIQKASLLVLQMADVSNHSEKDLHRLKEGVITHKRFLSQHIGQMIHMHSLKAGLLEEKIGSLQKTTKQLLQTEKTLIEEQISAIQQQMKGLPEKWKRENQLMMQRELSIGIIEGLSQLAESKNIRHQLFHVESKPIDRAVTPVKPSSSYFLVQGFLFALFITGIWFLWHFMKWLSQGQAITETFVSKEKIAFCGYIQVAFSRFLHEVSPNEKEVLRKLSSFIFSLQPQETGFCVTVLSPSVSLSANMASLLALQGKRVLLVQCTPLLVSSKEQKGLYDSLEEKSFIQKRKMEHYDFVPSGPYKSFFVELLFRAEFVSFIQENKKQYDIILLSLNAAPKDAAVAPLKELSSAVIVHGEDVFYEEIAPLAPVAVVCAP